MWMRYKTDDRQVLVQLREVVVSEVCAKAEQDETSTHYDK